MKARTRQIGNGLRRKAFRDAEDESKETRMNGQSVGESDEKWSHGHDEHIPLPSFSPRASSLIIAAVSLVCYWNTCYGDFVFDDSEAIINNKDLRPDSSILGLFVHDFWGGTLTANESHKSYRPLTVLTFRLNYWFSAGLHPWGFHFVNVVLNAIVSVLSLRVFNEVFGQNSSTRTSREGFLAGLIFAVHPIHTESVSIRSKKFIDQHKSNLLCPLEIHSLCFLSTFTFV